MFSEIAKIKIYLLLFIATIAISAFNIIGSYFYLKGPLVEDKIIVIEHGSSIHKISRQLKDEGVIKYPELFHVIAKFYAYKHTLKSGEYEFTSGITPYQVLQKLAQGRSVIHKFFIPEGLMVSEILNIISEEEKFSGKITDNIPEGYLMPSTYHFSRGDKRDKIIDMMRNDMSAAISEAMEILPKDSPIKTRKDVLILASIVEKEAGNDAERQKVAAVFINRLKKGMKLQADPTVAYGITEGKYKLDRPLSKKDLRTPSPYNTYTIYGLPKGPICCPGKKSVMAVVTPEETKALYFVVDGSGGHVFSNTLKEHNQHVQNYRNRSKTKKEKK